MFSGIWRKAKKKNMKKERKFGLKEFPRPLGYPNGGSNMGNGPQPANGGAPQGGSYQANAPAQNSAAGNQMYQQQRGNAQYGQTPPQGGFAGDGFTNIPEGMASQLPFTA